MSVNPAVIKTVSHSFSQSVRQSTYLEPYMVMTISTGIKHSKIGEATISVSLAMEVKTVHEAEGKIRSYYKNSIKNDLETNDRR